MAIDNELGHSAVAHHHHDDDLESIESVATDGFFGTEDHPPLRVMLSNFASQFFPAAGSNLLYFVNQTVTMMFVGHAQGPDALAMFALGLSMFNVCGLSLTCGICSALDTFAPQAYGRDGDKSTELGELLQRCLILCAILAIPILVFFYFAEIPFLLLFNDQLAIGAARFLHAGAPLLATTCVQWAVQRVLQAQHAPEAPLFGAAASAITCFALNFQYNSVSHFSHATQTSSHVTSGHSPLKHAHMNGHARSSPVDALVPRAFQSSLEGIDTAVWILTASSVVLNLVVFVWMYFDKRVILGNTKWPLAANALSISKAREYMAVAIPATFAICSEWWAFEIFVAVSARMSTTSVDTFSIFFNVMVTGFSLSSAVGQAASVYVGNSLGAHKPWQARAYARVGMFLATVCGLTYMLVIVVFHHFVYGLYTTDVAVLRELSLLLPLAIPLLLGDAIQTGAQGIYRGVGNQDEAAKFVMLSLWCISLPVAFVTTHVLFHWGVFGLVTGLFSGVAVEIPLLLVNAAVRWDWVALADRAAKEAHELEALAHPHGADASTAGMVEMKTLVCSPADEGANLDANTAPATYGSCA